MNTDEKLRCKKPIVTLLFISLALTLIDPITKVIFLNCYGYLGPFAWVSLRLKLAAIILFLLYILKFHEALKARICIPITLGLVAVYPLSFFYSSLIFDNRVYFEKLLFDLPIIISFALAAISALKGSSKKIFIVIATICGMLGAVVSQVDQFGKLWHLLRYGVVVDLFIRIAAPLAEICFFIALLIFVIKNKIPEKQTKVRDLC